MAIPIPMALSAHASHPGDVCEAAWEEILYILLVVLACKPCSCLETSLTVLFAVPTGSRAGRASAGGSPSPFLPSGMPRAAAPSSSRAALPLPVPQTVLGSLTN